MTTHLKAIIYFFEKRNNLELCTYYSFADVGISTFLVSEFSTILTLRPINLSKNIQMALKVVTTTTFFNIVLTLLNYFADLLAMWREMTSRDVTTGILKRIEEKTDDIRKSRHQ